MSRPPGLESLGVVALGTGLGVLLGSLDALAGAIAIVGLGLIAAGIVRHGVVVGLGLVLVGCDVVGAFAVHAPSSAVALGVGALFFVLAELSWHARGRSRPMVHSSREFDQIALVTTIVCGAGGSLVGVVIAVGSAALVGEPALWAVGGGAAAATTTIAVIVRRVLREPVA